MSGIEGFLSNVIQSFEFDDESLSGLEPYEFRLNETLSQPYRLELSLVAKDRKQCINGYLTAAGTRA